MTKNITCIGCPIGCRIAAETQDDNILNIEGFQCNIGKKYAEGELTFPTRMVTSLMKVIGSDEPVTVKTSKPIDKLKIFECLKQIYNTKALLPIKIGDVLIKNVCGTDVDIISTKELY